jgi:hypothetical protein
MDRTPNSYQILYMVFPQRSPHIVKLHTKEDVFVSQEQEGRGGGNAQVRTEIQVGPQTMAE